MPGAGMGRTAEELKGMGSPILDVDLFRCLVGHWKFKIDALLLSCTPFHPSSAQMSPGVPPHVALWSERKRGCESP